MTNRGGRPVRTPEQQARRKQSKADRQRRIGKPAQMDHASNGRAQKKARQGEQKMEAGRPVLICTCQIIDAPELHGEYGPGVDVSILKINPSCPVHHVHDETLNCQACYNNEPSQWTP